MGRFDAQVVALEDHLVRGLRSDRIRQLPSRAAGDWPPGRGFVLARDTAVDLGSPAVGSVGFLVWTASEGNGAPAHRVFLEGPDLPELAAQGAEPVPFGQVVVVRGDPPDDYEGYLALKGALYDLDLEGVAVRSLPSQGHLWCRIHADALARDFDLSHLGAGIVAGLSQLDFVEQVDVLFHTAGRAGLTPLADMAASTARVVGALIKRHEEEHAECDDCEYRDICDEQEHQEGAVAP